MTVTTEVSLARFSGNDSTTVFPYAFQVDLAADLIVVLVVTATGVEIPLVNGVDYTVTGIGGDETGGNVTYPLAGNPLATGETLTIYRAPQLLQATDLQSQGPYFAETQEIALDKLVRQIQALQDELDRTFKVPVSSGTAPASSLFADLWDSVSLFLNKTLFPNNSFTMDSATGDYVFNIAGIEVFRITATGISNLFSDIAINYVAPATALAELAALDIEVDATSLDPSSELHGINIAFAGVPGAGEDVSAIGIHGEIDPIHQHSGAFTTPDQAEYAARFPDGGAWTDELDGHPVFLADNDVIYIGAVAKFGDLEVILSTPASQDEFLVFEYQHTDTTWDVFAPQDGTNGFRQTGIIDWDSDALTNWKSDSDPGGADGSAGYYIRIRRTRNNVTTDPIVTTIKTLAATEYGWDKNGDVTINNLAFNGTVTPPATADSIDDTMIDWGAGANQVDADDMPESATRKWVSTDNVKDTHIDWGTGAGQVSATDLPDFGTMTQTKSHLLISDGTDFKSVTTSIYYVPGTYATIQAAIDAAEAAGGGLVFIAPGTYDEKLVIDSTGVTLIGSGVGITIINEDPDTGPALTITAGNTTLRNFSIGTNAGGGNAYSAIVVSSADYVTIEQVFIVASDHRGIDIVGTTSELKILNCDFNTIDDIGIVAGNTTGNIMISGCMLYAISGTQLIVIAADAGTITGCLGSTGSTRAIDLSADSSEFTVVGNNFTGAIADGGTNNLVSANNS